LGYFEAEVVGLKWLNYFYWKLETYYFVK